MVGKYSKSRLPVIVFDGGGGQASQFHASSRCFHLGEGVFYVYSVDTVDFCEGSLPPLPGAEAWAGRRVSVPLEHWMTLLAAEAAAVELEAAESPPAAAASS